MPPVIMNQHNPGRMFQAICDLVFPFLVSWQPHGMHSAAVSCEIPVEDHVCECAACRWSAIGRDPLGSSQL